MSIMTRDEIVKAVAEYWHIRPNDDGKFDTADYDWQAGCSKKGKWFCLAEVVDMIEEMLSN